MIDYTLILSRKYANCQWVLDGDNYEGLTWLSDSKKPTQKELDDQWQFVLDEIKSESDAKIVARQAILDRLGLTKEEAKLLLG